MTPDDAELVRGWFARMDVLRPKIEAIPDDAPEADVVVELCDIASEAIAHLGKRGATAATALSEAKAENERLREALDNERARLDFLDSLNHALNAYHKTNYRWELIVNHNVTRLMFKHMTVDLNDSAAHGFNSCRDAIDRKMAEFAASRRARAALNPKGGDNEA